MTDVSEKPSAASRRGKRVRRIGTVVSDKRDKTVKVVYEYTTKHPMYGKYIRRSTTLHAHDEANQAKNGDIVEVMACRRLSKTKCWRLLRIVTSAA